MARLLFALLFLPSYCFSWGFFAHQRINRMAVFTLPPEMVKFYKYHIDYLTETAVNPDKRRYIIEAEAPRHYIDLDLYGDSANYTIPRHWKTAVEKYTLDSLMARGIVPWHIYKIKMSLTDAFKEKNVAKILRLSADIGHYIGDSNVPLHTTSNYNGQQTGQTGIHGFWESRLPELFAEDYDYFTGKAIYLEHPLTNAWNGVFKANAALDSVLRFEKELSATFPEDKKYAYETRNNVLVRTYSTAYATAYNQMLNGQVERQMMASILEVGCFWYTCWVDAGKPDLNALLNKPLPAELQQEEEELQKHKHKPSREHEALLEGGCGGEHGCCSPTYLADH